MMNSRTFGHVITRRSEVTDAVVAFAQDCAKRLRSEHAVAGAVTVYIRGDRFRTDLPFYSNSCQRRLATPSASTMAIVHYALLALNDIYRDGFPYRKAGVLLTDITPDSGIQLGLFDRLDHGRQQRLMQAIDHINRHYGSEQVRLAPTIGKGEWRPVQSHLQSLNPTLRIYSGMLSNIII